MTDVLDVLDGTAARTPDDAVWLARMRDDRQLHVRQILDFDPSLIDFPGTLFDLARIDQQRGHNDVSLLPEVVREALAAADVSGMSVEGVRSLAKALELARPDSTQPNAEAKTSPQYPSRRMWPTIPGYALYGVLGRGGMGIVYLARHLRLDRLVALKVMNSHSATSPTHRLRFFAEAESVAKLQHPGIVSLFEIQDVDGETFFTLEYCPGGSLARSGQLLPTDAARIISDLAKAVDYAHKNGVVHRDIKPENVLKAADGTFKLADFGLAHRLDESIGMTGSADIIGTPAYMSPEQADPKGRLIGPAADVYGLGALLYRLLTGRPPFDGSTRAQIYHRVLHDEPDRLTVAIPSDLRAIVCTAMAKEPRHRYTSAMNLANDLERFLNGQPVTARPMPSWTRAWRWSKHNRAAAAAIAITIGSSLAIAGLAIATATTIRKNTTLENDKTMAKAVADQRASDAIDSAYRALKEERTAEATARLAGIDETLISDAKHSRLKQCRRDVETIERLEAIYLSDADTDAMQKPADLDTESALSQGGYPILEWTVEEVKTRVQASPIRKSIHAAMMHWAIHGDFDEMNADQMARLRALLDRLTAINDGKSIYDLSKLCRQPEQHAELFRLLEGADGLLWHTTAIVADSLKQNHLSAQLIRRAAAESPHDFHVLVNAGKIHWALGKEYRLLAVGFLRAAVSVRPQSLGARLLLIQMVANTATPGDCFAECQAAKKAGLVHPQITSMEERAKKSLTKSSAQP